MFDTFVSELAENLSLPLAYYADSRLTEQLLDELQELNAHHVAYGG